MALCTGILPVFIKEDLPGKLRKLTRKMLVIEEDQLQQQFPFNMSADVMSLHPRMPRMDVSVLWFSRYCKHMCSSEIMGCLISTFIHLLVEALIQQTFKNICMYTHMCV